LHLYLLTYPSIYLSTFISVSFSGVYNAKEYEGIGTFDFVFFPFLSLFVSVYARFRNFAVSLLIIIWLYLYEKQRLGGGRRARTSDEEKERKIKTE